MRRQCVVTLRFGGPQPCTMHSSEAFEEFVLVAVSTMKFVFFEGTIVRSCGYACLAYCACVSQLLACDGRTLSGSEERLFPSRGTFFRPMHSGGACQPACDPGPLGRVGTCPLIRPVPRTLPSFRPCSHVSFSLGRPSGVDPWDRAGSGGGPGPLPPNHTPQARRPGCVLQHDLGVGVGSTHRRSDTAFLHPPSSESDWTRKGNT